MKIKVGVSNRHIHLSEADFKALFGNIDFLVKKELSQDGEFASSLVLDIKTEKSVIKNVRVVGPLRERTQVEISRTDAYILGINPPIRMSGDFNGAVDVILSNGKMEMTCKNSCILANRHIHINPNEKNKYNINPGDIIKIKVMGERGGVLDNVLVKEQDNYNFELHIDTDEANAFGLKNGDEVEIIER